MVVCLERWKNGWMEDGQTGWDVWYWLLRGWVTKTSCLCYVSALQGDLSACFSLFYLLFVLWLTDWWRQMFPGFAVLCLNQICINSRKTFHFFLILLQKWGDAVVIKPSRTGVRTTLFGKSNKLFNAKLSSKAAEDIKQYLQSDVLRTKSKRQAKSGLWSDIWRNTII